MVSNVILVNTNPFEGTNRMTVKAPVEGWSHCKCIHVTSGSEILTYWPASTVLSKCFSVLHSHTFLFVWFCFNFDLWIEWEYFAYQKREDSFLHWVKGKVSDNKRTPNYNFGWILIQSSVVLIFLKFRLAPSSVLNVSEQNINVLLQESTLQYLHCM